MTALRLIPLTAALLLGACTGDGGGTDTAPSTGADTGTNDPSAGSSGATTGPTTDGPTTGSPTGDPGGDPTSATTVDPPTTGGDDTTGGPAAPTSCTPLWDTLLTKYPDAGTAGGCGDDPVAASLMRLAGLTIDNNGEPMQPCVEARCDDDFVYIATNELPHYDFVQTTPNALVEKLNLFRIPRAPQPFAKDPGGAEAATAIDGCEDAYAQYLDNAGQATMREPSQFCVAQDADNDFFYDDLSTGRAYYQKISCLGVTGLMINGDPVFGPNEAATPDPWGNPGYNYPSAPDDKGSGATLDLCGGHTSDQMHYHAAYEACFERDADGKPATSYVEATADWDFAAAISGTCAGESAVLGWMPDGYPIKGPCVCLERDGDGNCTDVKFARSAWVYAGLGEWGADPGEDAALGVEGMPCSDDAECCGQGACNFQCSHAVFADGKAPGGSLVDRRCVLVDYSWCTHGFVDRSADAPGDFVYLDRCNGFAGPDGFAYHTTMSFPYLPACYHGAAATQALTMGMGMGMDPPTCDMVPMGSKCCGDDLCDGPETAANCPEDCP